MLVVVLLLPLFSWRMQQPRLEEVKVGSCCLCPPTAAVATIVDAAATTTAIVIFIITSVTVTVVVIAVTVATAIAISSALSLLFLSLTPRHSCPGNAAPTDPHPPPPSHPDKAIAAPTMQWHTHHLHHPSLPLPPHRALTTPPHQTCQS